MRANKQGFAVTDDSFLHQYVHKRLKKVFLHSFTLADATDLHFSVLVVHVDMSLFAGSVKRNGIVRQLWHANQDAADGETACFQVSCTPSVP